MIKQSVILGLIIVLGGCSTSPPSSVEETYQQTKLTVDEYSKLRVIDGPYVSISFGIDGGGGIYLRKLNGVTQLVATTFSQLGWCFFDSAFDKNAGELPLQKTNSTVGRGVTYEDFYLKITDTQLAMMATSGLDVRVYGKNRTINIALPVIYVQGFQKRAKEMGQ